MAKRGNLRRAATAGWTAGLVAVLAPGIAHAHGPRRSGAPAGWVQHTPRLSDFPQLHERARFDARPRSGQRPQPGRSAHERRRLLVVPAAVPVYAYYGAPWPSDPPTEDSAPSVASAGPPPPPPAVGSPPQAIAAVMPAPETPIYFCSEINGYTNDLKLLQCPGRWQRVSP